MMAYCFRSCISISHSNDNNIENSHMHTVEVASFVKFEEMLEDVRRFDDTEKIIDECLMKYQEAYLNDVEGLSDDVSIEAFGEMLFYQLDGILKDNGMRMERFEISETPLRTYIITRTV